MVEKIDVFFTKYGYDSLGFFMKNLKKMTSVQQKLPFYLTKYGHDSRGFFMKLFKKMTLENCVFERMDIFLQNMGMTVVRFFGERTFS